MKIEKLPSGAYRVRKTCQGKTYSVLFDSKPSQAEALRAMSDLLSEVDISVRDKRKTFTSAYTEYIEIKSNVLSPSTLRGYRTLYNAIPEWFKETQLLEIDQAKIQKLINDYSASHSPKSSRNLHGLVSAVLTTFRPSMVINTTLPQKLQDGAYTPSDEDVRAVLEQAAGSRFEIALWLGVMGLRRSEVCALEYPNDLDGNILHINKALVPDVNNEWVVKANKTVESTRDIYIPDNLVEMIHAAGEFYNGYPNSIYDYLIRVENKLGLPHFSYHRLRHYYASMAHSLGIPDSYIMKAGGWKTDTVMKSVYRHALKDKNTEAQMVAAAHISDLLKTQ